MQASSRLLPFDRDAPGSWQRWENFWVDFLNAAPFLPWPGKPTVFKRVEIAEKCGVAGGSQDGIDVRAHMDDETILAVQCKDWKKIDVAKVVAAMDKAESEFKEARAYFLVFTEKEVSSGIQKEAEKRGNWLVIGRDTLSSWFLSGKLLQPTEQKRLVKQHFGQSWVRELFPLPGDDLLISTERFFQRKNLINHDAHLRGEQSQELVETLVETMGGNRPRVSILTAAGGQGKTRLLKEVAEKLNERSPCRKILFQNDSADPEAEDYLLRAEEFQNSSIFIDDAHRLENLKPRLLARISESPDATLLIAARPNTLESLKRKLLHAGFKEEDWTKHTIPKLDFAERKAIASEMLGGNHERLAVWLAEQSEGCLLVCTAGADLFKAGKLPASLIGSPEFKRRVFDYLMESSLTAICGDDQPLKRTAEEILRVIAMVSPIEKKRELTKTLATILDCREIDIDRLIPQLECAGLLSTTRNALRTIPDLLADHLVYDTAYGEGKLPSLVDRTIDTLGGISFANLFGNLAEAEWRAKQEGKEPDYLDGMWQSLQEQLQNLEDQLIYSLLDAWRRFSIFQPERTLKLVRILLDHEHQRDASDGPTVVYEKYRYDPISIHLEKLPDLLAPLAFHHRTQREEALDLLWETGLIKLGPGALPNDLPAAWQKIVETGSLSRWETSGPQDTFDWIKKLDVRNEIKMFETCGLNLLSGLANQWFALVSAHTWMEGDSMVRQRRPIRSAVVEEFRFEVIAWLEAQILPQGFKSCDVVFSLLCSTRRDLGNSAGLDSPTEEQNARTRIVERCLDVVEKGLDFYPDPVLRLYAWQRLSDKFVGERQAKIRLQIGVLRDSIPRDLPFELARLSSGFSRSEWTRENLKEQKAEDWGLAVGWWSELASSTASELRQIYPSVHDSLEVIDQVDRTLRGLNRRGPWDTVAEAWSKRFPEERQMVLDILMTQADHAMVPCMGYFLGLADEADSEISESYILRALGHEDDRVRRAVLHRLSWRDVKRREPIANRLKEMAASDGPALASDMISFISGNQYEGNPYLDEVLAALNCGIISEAELGILGGALAHLLEYADHPLGADLLTSYFLRLQQQDFDIERVIPEHVMSVFHQRFPMEMFNIYLHRVRSGGQLPWSLDVLQLPNLASHHDYESMAYSFFGETIQADDKHFHQLRELFYAAVASVRPELAARMLEEVMDTLSIKRIIALTGCGNGSIVYSNLGFTKKLLHRIAQCPPAEAKELERDLIWNSGPSMWGWTDGEVDEEYLWARDLAGRKAEETRGDEILHNFFKSIVRNQELRVVETRQRNLEEFDDD